MPIATRRPSLARFGAAMLGACAATTAAAQEAAAPRSDSVVITGPRVEQRRFDVPAAVDVVDGETLRSQQLRINLSEGLARVPGLVAQNRQNYAQDLQVSSRGFGARAAFGVRGVRLIQDGIPLTMPDGQGQTATFDLDGAGRVEVLRGPFAALYGNASGGVVQLITEDAPARPTIGLSTFAGSFGSWRAGLRFGASSGAFSGTGNLSRFSTDGYRDHSAAVRDSANIKLGWKFDDDASLTLIGNWLDQPDTQDPLGLTQEQLDADRRQAGTRAKLYDTSKSIDHSQLGLVYKRRFGAAGTLELLGYSGQRRIVQRLSIPVTAQGITSSGGIVDLDRDFDGLGLHWKHAGSNYNLSFGLDLDRMRERRRGYVNDESVQGALRRDEVDRVRNTDQFVIADWRLAEGWKLAGGVRHSSVRFSSDDRFIVGPNPDDSGSASYSATLPVIGLLFEASPSTHLFASIGKGFETPTFAELAYRQGGQPGLNFALQAARSLNAELGVKSRLAPGVELTATLFRSRTRDEVVAATSSGGRNTFTNADRTQRSGVELSGQAQLGDALTLAGGYTYTDARFKRYVTVAGVDLSGKRIPGVPRHSLFAELGWQHAPTGLSAALEWRAVSTVFAADDNAAGARSYHLVNLRAGWTHRAGDWQLNPYLRIDNLFDREYVGSVIVNEANKRYFEPAPGRQWALGLNATYRF